MGYSSFLVNIVHHGGIYLSGGLELVAKLHDSGSRLRLIEVGKIGPSFTSCTNVHYVR